MTIYEPDEIGPVALIQHSEYRERLDLPSITMEDLLVAPVEQLAAMSRVRLCMDMTPEMIERRADRFREVILARIDSEPEFVGQTAWPASIVRSIVGADPRLIPGVRVTHGLPALPRIDPVTRLYTGTAGDSIMFDYVNGDDVRAWVIGAPWTQGHQVRPLHINGVEIASWNIDVGCPP